jgi:pyroglutamyl-peptidase
VPAQLSRDAGRYLCNHVYWRGLELAGARPRVVFVHVPNVRRWPVPRRAKQRMAMADLVRAGEAILLTLLADARSR